MFFVLIAQGLVCNLSRTGQSKLHLMVKTDICSCMFVISQRIVKGYSQQYTVQISHTV